MVVEVGRVKCWVRYQYFDNTMRICESSLLWKVVMYFNDSGVRELRRNTTAVVLLEKKQRVVYIWLRTFRYVVQ